MGLVAHSKSNVLYKESCPRLEKRCGESPCNAAGDANTAPNQREKKRPPILAPGERPALGGHRAGLHPRAKLPRSQGAEPVPRVAPAAPAAPRATCLSQREGGRDRVAQPSLQVRPLPQRRFGTNILQFKANLSDLQMFSIKSLRR